MECEGDGGTSCDWCTRNNLQRLGKETRRLRNQRMGREPPNYSMIKIGQNTEESPGDLRRLTQTPA